MKHLVLNLFACLSLGMPSYCILNGQTESKPNDQAAQQKNLVSAPAQQQTGDDVFKANCARCRMPPMALSPRITGTVVMHMRTRARLSRQDERLLMKFLAP